MKYIKIHIALIKAIIVLIIILEVGNCFGQLYSGEEKVVIVQRVSPGPNQDSIKTYFRENDKIRMMSHAYEQALRGRISSVSDSGFYVDDKFVRPKDIVSINHCRGRANMITGASVLAGGSLLLGVIIGINENNTTQVSHVNHQPISIIFEIALVAVSVTGYFIGISGAIANSLSWHYGNDAKTRIYIGPQMKVSNKFREKTRNLRFNNMQNVPGIH